MSDERWSLVERVAAIAESRAGTPTERVLVALDLILESGETPDFLLLSEFDGVKSIEAWRRENIRMIVDENPTGHPHQRRITVYFWTWGVDRPYGQGDATAYRYTNGEFGLRDAVLIAFDRAVHSVRAGRVRNYLARYGARGVAPNEWALSQP